MKPKTLQPKDFARAKRYVDRFDVAIARGITKARLHATDSQRPSDEALLNEIGNEVAAAWDELENET